MGCQQSRSPTSCPEYEPRPNPKESTRRVAVVDSLADGKQGIGETQNDTQKLKESTLKDAKNDDNSSSAALASALPSTVIADKIISSSKTADTTGGPAHDSKPQHYAPLLFHRHSCDGCHVRPILGKRFHATNVKDYDLCARCNATMSEVAEGLFVLEEVDLDEHDLTTQEKWYQLWLESDDEFWRWLDVHNQTTSLDQQIQLARDLYDKACGPEENPPTTQQIIECLKQTPIHGTDSLVTWKGFQVGWFLGIFCKSPFIQKLMDFGCELWFIRKVCIIEIIRRSNKGKGTVFSGPFANHIDSVCDCWGLERVGSLAAPTTFVSYTGAYTLNYLLQALEKLEPTDHVWVDIFCVDQFAWTGKGRSEEMAQFRETFMDELQAAIQNIGKTSLVLQEWTDAMTTLGQIWVLWEIFNTAQAGADLAVLLPKDQISHYITTCLESTKEFDQIEKSLSLIDVNKSKAQDESDRALIFERMHQVGLGKVNEVVITKMRDWFIDIGNAHLAHLRDTDKGSSMNATFLNNLAMIMVHQGRLREAEPLLQEALQVTRVHRGDQHESTLTSSHNLAHIFAQQGNLDEAEQMWRESLSAHRKMLGTDHKTTLNVLNSLASLLRERGKLNEAQTLFREGLDVYQMQSGRDEEDYLLFASNYVLLLQDLGDLGRAAEMGQQVLDTRRKCYGDKHPVTLNSISILGTILEERGKMDQAEKLYQECLTGRRLQLGNSHPSTLGSISNLALFLNDRGGAENNKVAEALGREALAGGRQVLGDLHPDTLTYIGNLSTILEDGASIFRDRRRLMEAESLIREALSGVQQQNGPEHLLTLNMLNSRAMMLIKLGNLTEACEVLEQCVQGRRRTLGDTHAITLTAMSNLGRALKDLGRLSEARTLLHEGYSGRVQTLGAEHPLTLQTKKALASIPLEP